MLFRSGRSPGEGIGLLTPVYLGLSLHPHSGFPGQDNSKFFYKASLCAGSSVRVLLTPQGSPFWILGLSLKKAGEGARGTDK